MKGIDISSWQDSLSIGNIQADFVIIKATGGKGYVNPSCDKHYQQALASGKRIGVYHFRDDGFPGTANEEAEFFVSNVRGYLKQAVLVLDWENGVSDVNWAKEWLDKVTELTGVKPIIYMSESVVNSYDWSAVAGADYGLWVAKYRDYNPDYNYDMATAGSAPSVKHWNGYAMWQWTSSGRLDGYGGNLDLNEFYGDTTAWDKYAGGQPGTPSAPGQIANPQPAPQPPVSQEVYVVRSGDTLSAIAAQYGTSYQKIAADNGIANPNMIYTGQRLVINKGTGGRSAQRTYIVVGGDTLGAIGAKFGVPYIAIAQANGISNPNLIFPGQLLMIP